MGNRIHSIDEYAFDVITPASAYWIGFLMADGDVRGRYVRLGLGKRDRAHVEAFRAFLGSSHRIHEGRIGCGLAVSSNRLVLALKNCGIVERKTFTCQAPEQLRLDRHFWRGVIDGDGSLGIYPRKPPRDHESPRPILSVVGSMALMGQCADFFRGHGVGVRVRPRGRLGDIHVSGARAVRLASLLYDGDGPELARKRAIVRQMQALPTPRAYTVKVA